MRAPLAHGVYNPRAAWAVAVATALLIGSVACSNDPAACSAPSSGTFTTTLTYGQADPVSLACEGGGADASACAARAHTFDKQAWTIAVSGSTATVTTPAGTWTCAAIVPRSAPSSTADGGTVPSAGCYIEVRCGDQPVGDAGVAQVDLQILAKASTDVLVLVHDDGVDCCTDVYTGAWH